MGHKTPHKSFMLIIEEWVLVTNPYAVGYHSSTLFLVLHNHAICLHNTRISDYTIALASKDKCRTSPSVTHSLFWTQPRAIKCKVIHNKPFFFLSFPLRECLINSSYGQQSILWDCFPLERYTAFFMRLGIKTVQGKFRVMTLNINVLVFPNADLYISHTWSVATDMDIQPVELRQTSLLVSLFVFFFFLLNPPPKSLADSQQSTLKTVSTAFSQVPLRELLHSSAVYSSPRYP